MSGRRFRRAAPVTVLALAAVLFPVHHAQAWKAEFALAPPSSAAPGAITSVARHADALDVFWIHPDGAISTAAWTAASGRWVTRPVAPAGAAAAGSMSGSLSVVARNSDHLDLFWIRPDGGVSTSWWHTGDTGWAGALTIAAAQRALPGTLAVAARNPNQFDVFWTERDRSIGTTAWNPYHGWLQPWRLTGAGAAHHPGALTVVSRARDHLDLFWVRPDAGVSTLWWNPVTPWSSRPITGAGHVRIGSSREWVRPALTAVSHRDDQIDVFWIGPDGAIGTTVWNSRLNWPSPWTITSPGTAQPGALDAVSRSPGRFDLVSVAPDGAIRNLTFDEKIPGSWATAPVTGSGRAQGNAVSVTTRHPGALDAFWIRPDGGVGTNWWHRERIRVHFKVVNQPTLDYAVIETQLAHMVTAFAQAEIGVELAGVEHITVTGGDTIEVGPCNKSNPPTQEAVDLFNHRNNVRANEIALYVVRHITPSRFSGCARHPDGKPSAVLISSIYDTAVWTAAHETGHVLGLKHPPCTSPPDFECLRNYGNRLMLETRVYLSKPVPEITSDEKVTMYRSPLSN